MKGTPIQDVQETAQQARLTRADLIFIRLEAEPGFKEPWVELLSLWLYSTRWVSSLQKPQAEKSGTGLCDLEWVAHPLREGRLTGKVRGQTL